MVFSVYVVDVFFGDNPPQFILPNQEGADAEKCPAPGRLGGKYWKSGRSHPNLQIIFWQFSGGVILLV